jgi:hypothetical protein
MVQIGVFVRKENVRTAKFWCLELLAGNENQIRPLATARLSKNIRNGFKASAEAESTF